MSPGPNPTNPDQSRQNRSKKESPDEEKSELSHFFMRSSPIGSACQSPNRLCYPLDRTQIWEPFLHHFLRFSWNRPLQINHLHRKLHHGFSSALIVAHPSYLSDPDPNLFVDL